MNMYEIYFTMKVEFEFWCCVTMHGLCNDIQHHTQHLYSRQNMKVEQTYNTKQPAFSYLNIHPCIRSFLKLQPLRLVFWEEILDFFHVDLKIRCSDQILLICGLCYMLEDMLKRIGDNSSQLRIIFDTYKCERNYVMKRNTVTNITVCSFFERFAQYHKNLGWLYEIASIETTNNQD